jgi:hypothetical protein
MMINVISLSVISVLVVARHYGLIGVCGYVGSVVLLYTVY